MGNFQGGGARGGFRGGDRGGKPSFGGKPRFGGGDRGDRGDVTMHKAVCSECGKNTEVPFKPTGDKPVYCKDCFNAKRDDSDTRGGARPSYDRAPRRDYGDKPSFRSSDRGERPAYKPAPANDETKKVMQEISTKLDKLINAVERLADSSKAANHKEDVKNVVAKAMKEDKPKGKVVKKKKA